MCLVRDLRFRNYNSSRQEKYEKLKAGPQKHDFNDPDFIQTRERIMEETDEAFEQGNFSCLLNWIYFSESLRRELKLLVVFDEFLSRMKCFAF